MHLQLLIQESVIEEFVLFQKKKPRQYYSSIHVSIGQKFIISSAIFFYKYKEKFVILQAIGII